MAVAAPGLGDALRARSGKEVTFTTRLCQDGAPCVVDVPLASDAPTQLRAELLFTQKLVPLRDLIAGLEVILELQPKAVSATPIIDPLLGELREISLTIPSPPLYGARDGSLYLADKKTLLTVVDPAVVTANRLHLLSDALAYLKSFSVTTKRSLTSLRAQVTLPPSLRQSGPYSVLALAISSPSGELLNPVVILGSVKASDVPVAPSIQRTAIPSPVPGTGTAVSVVTKPSLVEATQKSSDVNVTSVKAPIQTVNPTPSVALTALPNEKDTYLRSALAAIEVDSWWDGAETRARGAPAKLLRDLSPFLSYRRERSAREKLVSLAKGVAGASVAAPLTLLNPTSEQLCVRQLRAPAGLVPSSGIPALTTLPQNKRTSITLASDHVTIWARPGSEKQCQEQTSKLIEAPATAPLFEVTYVLYRCDDKKAEAPLRTSTIAVTAKVKTNADQSEECNFDELTPTVSASARSLIPPSAIPASPEADCPEGMEKKPGESRCTCPRGDVPQPGAYAREGKSLARCAPPFLSGGSGKLDCGENAELITMANGSSHCQCEPGFGVTQDALTICQPIPKCPADKYLDASWGFKCIDKCGANQLWSKDANGESCSCGGPGHPFYWDGTKCLPLPQCAPGEFFDQTVKACKRKCEPGSYPVLETEHAPGVPVSWGCCPDGTIASGDSCVEPVESCECPEGTTLNSDQLCESVSACSGASSTPVPEYSDSSSEQSSSTYSETSSSDSSSTHYSSTSDSSSSSDTSAAVECEAPVPPTCSQELQDRGSVTLTQPTDSAPHKEPGKTASPVTQTFLTSTATEAPTQSPVVDPTPVAPAASPASAAAAAAANVPTVPPALKAYEQKLFKAIEAFRAALKEAQQGETTPPEKSPSWVDDPQLMDDLPAMAPGDNGADFSRAEALFKEAIEARSEYTPSGSGSVFERELADHLMALEYYYRAGMEYYANGDPQEALRLLKMSKYFATLDTTDRRIAQLESLQKQKLELAQETKRESEQGPLSGDGTTPSSSHGSAPHAAPPPFVIAGAKLPVPSDPASPQKPETNWSDEQETIQEEEKTLEKLRELAAQTPEPEESPAPVPISEQERSGADQWPSAPQITQGDLGGDTTDQQGSHETSLRKGGDKELPESFHVTMNKESSGQIYFQTKRYAEYADGRWLKSYKAFPAPAVSQDAAQIARVVGKVATRGRTTLKIDVGVVYGTVPDPSSFRFKSRAVRGYQVLRDTNGGYQLIVQLAADDAEEELLFSYNLVQQPSSDALSGLQFSDVATTTTEEMNQLEAQWLSPDMSPKEKAAALSTMISTSMPYTSGDNEVNAYVTGKGQDANLSKIDRLQKVFLNHPSLPEGVKGKGLDCDVANELFLFRLSKHNISGHLVSGFSLDPKNPVTLSRNAHGWAEVRDKESQSFLLADATPLEVASEKLKKQLAAIRAKSLANAQKRRELLERYYKRDVQSPGAQAAQLGDELVRELVRYEQYLGQLPVPFRESPAFIEQQVKALTEALNQIDASSEPPEIKRVRYELIAGMIEHLLTYNHTDTQDGGLYTTMKRVASALEQTKHLPALRREDIADKNYAVKKIDGVWYLRDRKSFAWRPLPASVAGPNDAIGLRSLQNPGRSALVVRKPGMANDTWYPFFPSLDRPVEIPSTSTIDVGAIGRNGSYVLVESPVLAWGDTQSHEGRAGVAYMNGTKRTIPRDDFVNVVGWEQEQQTGFTIFIEKDGGTRRAGIPSDVGPNAPPPTSVTILSDDPSNKESTTSRIYVAADRQGNVVLRSEDGLALRSVDGTIIPLKTDIIFRYVVGLRSGFSGYDLQSQKFVYISPSGALSDISSHQHLPSDEKERLSYVSNVATRRWRINIIADKSKSSAVLQLHDAYADPDDTGRRVVSVKNPRSVPITSLKMRDLILIDDSGSSFALPSVPVKTFDNQVKILEFDNLKDPKTGAAVALSGIYVEPDGIYYLSSNSYEKFERYGIGLSLDQSKVIYSANGQVVFTEDHVRGITRHRAGFFTIEESPTTDPKREVTIRFGGQKLGTVQRASALNVLFLQNNSSNLSSVLVKTGKTGTYYSAELNDAAINGFREKIYTLMAADSSLEEILDTFATDENWSQAQTDFVVRNWQRFSQTRTKDERINRVWSSDAVVNGFTKNWALSTHSQLPLEAKLAALELLIREQVPTSEQNKQLSEETLDQLREYLRMVQSQPNNKELVQTFVDSMYKVDWRWRSELLNQLLRWMQTEVLAVDDPDLEPRDARQQATTALP